MSQLQKGPHLPSLGKDDILSQNNPRKVKIDQIMVAKYINQGNPLQEMDKQQ